VVSVVSLDGFRLEVTFSEQMDPDNPALLDTASYTPAVVAGAAPTTILSVEEGVAGVYGPTSVILHHNGTTLGGRYSLSVTGVTDVSGNPLDPDPAVVSLYTLGEPPPFVVTPLSHTELLVDFEFDMLPVAGGSTIDQLASYDLSHDPHPVTTTLTGVTFPYLADDSQVLLDVDEQTNHLYTLSISPADAIEYDASVLPDADPGFTGTEILPANGTSNAIGGYLTMSRSASTSYGWSFEDTSGRLLAGTTFRADFTFDASAATYSPALSTLPKPFTLGLFEVEDAAPGVGVKVAVFLQQNASGDDELALVSGAYSSAFPADWSTGGQHTITLVRNIKADTYTLLYDGVVITSEPIASFTGVSADVGGPGALWAFSAATATTVAGFRVYGLVITATSTVYSAAWNFLHGFSSVFTGSTLLTNDALLTKRGPLVKGWGDATPATKQDVIVYVDGTPVDVLDVNPYIGRIQLAIAIPLMDPAAPAHVITVDYKWMATPVMVMAGLNVPGLVLNKWDVNGKMPNSPRFPMAVVLGPNVARRAPPLIGHRYLGFEQAYSAVLNSPTTLLLNQPPGRTSVPAFERMPDPVTVAYEGTQVPTASDLRRWAVEGTDAGGVNIGGLLAGTYTVTDDNPSSYDPSDESAVVYHRGVDLSFPSAVSVVGRFFGVGADTPATLNPLGKAATSPEGVFTGISFGVHNNERLYLVGALLVNDVEHVGLLLNALRPYEAGSWQIGPIAPAAIQDATTATMATADHPTDLRAGERFQILEGTQAGVYTIDTLVRQTDGTTTITVSPSFPANPKLWGNRDFDLVFEALWSTNPSTYRLDVDPDNGVAQVVISGTTVGTVASIDSAPDLPLPADTSLLLSPRIRGQVFWGSTSRPATSSSTWSFIRYSVTPDETTIRDRRLTAEAEMSIVPEDEPTKPWAVTQTFGLGEIDASGNALLLKSTTAHPTLDLTYGYSRVEAFFTPKATLDLRATFRVESGTLGGGDAQIALHDTDREVRLGTLLYREDVAATPYRQLISLPQASFTGLFDPLEQDWEVEAANGTFSTEHRERALRITTGPDQAQPGGWVYQNASSFSPTWVDQKNRIVEGRFAMVSWTADGTDQVGTPMILGISGRQVALVLTAGVTPQVQLADWTPTIIQSYSFDWTDGEPHTYRLVGDFLGDTLSLFIDGVLQGPTVALSSFPTISDTVMNWGFFHANIDQSAVIDWYSGSMVVQPPVDAKRTLGIWLGGDPQDIDNWELPRTDPTAYANSNQIGPIIEEMDWTSDVEVRLLRDPTWGVTLYRPDLPLPPYYASDYDPDLGKGQGFVNDTTEVSAGWINVEYRNLPREPETFGLVSFGSLFSGSVSQQRWDRVSYLLFRHPTEDYRAPQHMVLNRYNVIHSGELTRDKTPEQVIVQTLSETELTLLPTHLYADRVFKVMDGTVIFTPEMFSFETKMQHLTLLPDAEGNVREFSGSGVAVTVVFAPGNPVTNTYLLNQPLLDSVTLLNEGTPPVPKSQSAFYDRHVVYGPDILTDPPVDDRLLTVDATNPAHVLSDPYRVHVFRDGDDPSSVLANSLYENMQFYEIPGEGEEGLLSSICEGTLGQGDSGWDPDAGEPIYSPTGGGAQYPGVGESGNLFETGDHVGEPFGPFVLGFGNYQETGFTPQSSLGGAVGVGFIASGGGVDGSLLAAPGANPLAVLEPVLKGNSDSTVVIVMQDTTTGATTQWEFVE
jgi:hypothetical protein